MLGYIFSFLKKEKNENSGSDKFCYIVGSFASTAPNLRTPISDIDIICSKHVDEFEIRYHLKKKFPNIPSDIPLDIKYLTPTNGVISYQICYWQEPKCIPIIDNSNIKPVGIHGEINLPALVRNPKKKDLISYLNNSKQIEITHPIHFENSVKNHYNAKEFVDVLNTSNLDYEEKNIIKKLLDASTIGQNKYKNNYVNITLDRENKSISDCNRNFTYFNFYRNFLGYNCLYSAYYSFPVFKKIEMGLNRVIKNLKLKYPEHPI